MNDIYHQMLKDFHVALECTRGDTPELRRAELRISLIEEETRELVEAMKKQDPIETIDALCDLLYVAYGAADVFGVTLCSFGRENLPPRIPPRGLGRTGEEAVVAEAHAADFARAVRDEDIENATYLLEDIIYHCWELGPIYLGVNLQPFFREVHRTNMLKKGGPRRESDGKRLKPPGWKPPRIEAMYERVKGLMAPECICDEAVRTVEQHPEGGVFCTKCGGLITDPPVQLNLVDKVEVKDGFSLTRR